ncbi:FRIGIDA-like protein [Forsythia ovata]|uniref:FRIGIDA-like protein n=1 Tax=Forsythia ovata TaxID=205694 RepID=A0ABD1QB49_9LAMI
MIVVSGVNGGDEENGEKENVIQKLISKGKQYLALKFIFEFELTSEFPTAPLLESYLIDTKKLAQKVRKTGKHSRQLVTILEYQYPKDGLVTCIENLEKEKTDRSQCAATAVSKPKKLKPKHRKKWREKQRQAAAGLSTIKKNDPHNSAIPSSQSSHLQSAESYISINRPQEKSQHSLARINQNSQSTLPSLSSPANALAIQEFGFNSFTLQKNQRTKLKKKMKKKEIVVDYILDDGSDEISGGTSFVSRSRSWGFIKMISRFNMNLGINNGLLVAIPNPKEYSASGNLMESAIH